MAKGSGISPILQRLQQASIANKARHMAPAKARGDTFTVDLKEAREPERLYYAKECWCQYERGIVVIYFSQKKRDDKTLRSLICVNMTPAAMVQWLQSVDEMNSPTLAELAENISARPERIEVIPGEAEQTIEISANIARTAVSSHEATIDFHKISPFSFLDAKSGNALRLEPQIRIDLRTTLFLGLINELHEMKKSFPKDALKSGE